MIVVGGLTRLTDSGLSITKWELFSGFLPPLNQNDWILYFDLYKLIKIGKNSIDKQFVLGVGKYDNGIGFVNGLVSGFDIAILVGKLPASLFISGRGHIVRFNDIGITYWGVIHAGLGIEIR